jgi:hypothetical protein
MTAIYTDEEFAILSFKNNGPLSRELQALFPRNLIHDPQHTLDGMLVLRCFFCNGFQTPIEYDMRVHLLERHRMELVTHLPLRGKGFNMEYITAFVIARPQTKLKYRNVFRSCLPSYIRLPESMMIDSDYVIPLN